MLSCQECQKYLVAFLDGALDVAESLDVELYADDNRLAPRINLRGYWLQRPGFKAKDRTRTRVRQGGLAITAERGEGTPPRWTEASLRRRRQGGGWLSQSPFAA